jgi:hypothetical protein
MLADDRPIVEAISQGSKDAFAQLFDFTSGAVRAELLTHLKNADQAVAVFAATYVEVWWLAGCHSAAEVGVLEWIRHILRRRIADVTTALDPAVDLWPSHAEIELATLLGRPLKRLWAA